MAYLVCAVLFLTGFVLTCTVPKENKNHKSIALTTLGILTVSSVLLAIQSFGW